jgi:ABC-2 type transport system permease protein
VNGTLVTLKKELLSYVCSPVSYLIAVLFYLWRGLEVTQTARLYALYQADQDLFPSACYDLPSTFWMVVLVPGTLTMRCFAEERRTGSIETLMTAPVRDAEVVLGKWLAAVAFYALLWLPTVVLLWCLRSAPFLGTDLAFGPVFAAYLGMFLLSAMLMAFGCFASSLTDNLLLAAIVPVLFNFGILTLPQRLASALGEQAANPYVAELLQKLDVLGGFRQWFARGLIDTSQIWFYAGGTAFFLFLTVLSVSARRIA